MAVPTDVGWRIDRLVDRLGDAADGAALVVLNVRYLTGFTGGAATLVATPDRTTLVTNGRYGVLAADISGTGINVEVTDDDGRAVITSAVGASKRIDLEADEVSWTRLRTFPQPNRTPAPTTYSPECLRVRPARAPAFDRRSHSSLTSHRPDIPHTIER